MEVRPALLDLYDSFFYSVKLVIFLHLTKYYSSKSTTRCLRMCLCFKHIMFF